MKTATAPKKKSDKSKAEQEKEREARLEGAGRLVPEIKAAHQAVVQSLESGLTKAIEAGEKLAEAKKLIDHGAWEKWVEANCDFSPRTARNYIRVFQDRAKLQDRDEISYRRAIKRLARNPEDEPKKQKKRPPSSIEGAKLRKLITRYKVNADVDALRPLLKALGITLKEAEA